MIPRMQAALLLCALLLSACATPRDSGVPEPVLDHTPLATDPAQATSGHDTRAPANLSRRCPAIPKESLDLIAQDPVKLAEAEAASTAPRFLGIAADDLYTPGAPGDAHCWFEAGLARSIEGTTDVICDSQTAALMQGAGPFAYAYNQRLLQLVPRLSGHSCTTAPP